MLSTSNKEQETKQESDNLSKFKNHFVSTVDGSLKNDFLGNPVSDQLGERVTPIFMKFFAAQVKKSKPYSFACTIISEEELDNLFNKLQSEQKPINKKIAILTSKYTSVPHWFNTQIKIEEGHIQVLLVCTLGTWRRYFDDLIEKIKKNYPADKLTVYVDLTTRQKDHDSCSIFSLEDTKDLQKMSDYLPPQYQGDIFKYLDQNTSTQEERYGFTLKHSQLPLIMMRRTQSKKLFRKIIPKRNMDERKWPINKKNETTLDYAIRNFTKRKINRFFVALLTMNEEPNFISLEEAIKEYGLPLIVKGPDEQLWVAGMDSHGEKKLTKFSHASKYPSMHFPLKSSSCLGKFYSDTNKVIDEQFYLDLIHSESHDPSTYSLFLKGCDFERNYSITRKFFKTLNKTRQYLIKTEDKELEKTIHEFGV